MIRWGTRARAGIVGASLLIGLTVGVGTFTFWYAKGASYLTDDPKACVNCHIMQDQYNGWTRSSHHAVATCNDCHTPEGLVPKYLTKAINGYNHSMAFTLQNFHEPIQINSRNRAITEAACLKCHAEIVAAITPASKHPGGTASDCLRCHANVGHLH